MAAPTFDLAAYRGKVVVVNFWASWCVECKLEAKTLRDAAARWRGKDVVVIGVDTKDLAFAAKRYMARYDVNYGGRARRRRLGERPLGRHRLSRRRSSSTAAGKVIPPHVDGPIPAARLNAAIRQAIRS